MLAEVAGALARVVMHGEWAAEAVEQGAGRGVGVLDGLVLGVDLAVVVGGETDPSLEQEIAGLKTELGKVEQHGRLQSAVLTVARDPDARVSGFSDDEHAKIQREGVGLRRP